MNFDANLRRAGVLTMDEARRLASDFAKLPALLGPEWRSSSNQEARLHGKHHSRAPLALGADCWTGREFAQPRFNERWERVFLSSFVVDHICGHACRWTLFGRNALAMRLLRREEAPLAQRGTSRFHGGTCDGGGSAVTHR